MPSSADNPDFWDALSHSGEVFATEDDYEHGYAGVVRRDLEQYVTFGVGVENYGVHIARIGEIAKPFDTTPVPRTADFVRGIGNVRGVVIPVVDLAMRLRLPATKMSRQTRTLIVRHEEELYGLVVDRVDGVLQIAPEDLEDAPGALAGARGDFIQALARDRGKIIIVLDLSVVLDPADFLGPSLRQRGGVRAW